MRWFSWGVERPVGLGVGGRCVVRGLGVRISVGVAGVRAAMKKLINWYVTVLNSRIMYMLSLIHI